MNSAIERISPDTLAELWFGFKHQLFEKLQTAFRSSGLQQKEVAARIGRDPATVTRCLKGQRDIDIRTMHDLARGMGYRLRIEIDRLDGLKPKRSNRARRNIDSRGDAGSRTK